MIKYKCKRGLCWVLFGGGGGGEAAKASNAMKILIILLLFVDICGLGFISFEIF